MSKRNSVVGHILVAVVLGVLLLSTGSVLAQTASEPSLPNPGVPEPTQLEEKPELDDPATDPAEPDEENTNASNPPAYIHDLVEGSDLTREQVDQMRANGAGWGNIKIAAYLAEAIAAKSADTDTPLKFDDALALVLAARAEDMGFGEIAKENDLKIGQLNRNRSQVQEPADGDGQEMQDAVQAGEAIQVRGKKRGLLARIGGMLGFGRARRAEKAERALRVAASAKKEKAEKPERPSRPQKAERPERPERLEKPAKPEKPERPARPEKPEKPERGPRR